MWQKFTERARRVILLAQEEAGRMNSGHVGTEHLLIGLLRENEGIAAKVLARNGITLARVSAEVEAATPREAEAYSGEPGFTRKSSRVFKLAAAEARRLKHDFIGTEHLLLGITREKDGLAAPILRRLGLGLDEARAQVLEFLGPQSNLSPPSETGQAQLSATSFRVAPVVRDALESAAKRSRDAGRDSIEVADILLALCQGEAAEQLRAAGISVEDLRIKLGE